MAFARLLSPGFFSPVKKSNGKINMMFTDHEAAVEEAHFLQDTNDIVIVTNDEADKLWVLSAKQLNSPAYNEMRVLERFKKQ